MFRVERDRDGAVADLELVDTNQAREERTGVTRQRAVGRRLSDSSEEDERTKAYFAAVAAAARLGAPACSELHIRTDDTHELLEAYPVGPELWALSALDITEIVRAERDVARLNADL